MKLKEYIHQIRGVSYKPADSSDKHKEGYIPLLRANNINNGKINFENLIYVKKEKVKEVQYLKKGDILICTSSGSKELVGKAGLIREDVNATFGAFCKVIRLRECCNYNYFNHYFQSNYYKSMIQNSSNGANINNLKTENFDSLNVNMVNYDIQTIIASKLDKIQETIDIRKKQIKELNELIKSKFIYMFENGKYNRKSLNEISIIKGEYGSGASAGEYKEGKPRYVRITDIQDDGRLSNNSLASPQNENNTDKYILKYGDILFARTGATVGKAYKYSETDGYCIYAGYCIRFRLDTSIVNPNYIFVFTSTDEYRKWVENKQRIVAQPNINAKEYGNDLLIPIPPIELQNEFSYIVKQIDKHKLELQRNLEEIQKLQESLMNKYFN